MNKKYNLSKKPNLYLYILTMGFFLATLLLYWIRLKLSSYSGYISHYSVPYHPYMMIFIVIPVSVFFIGMTDLPRINIYSLMLSRIICIPCASYILFNGPDLLNHIYHLTVLSQQRYDVLNIDGYTAKESAKENMIIYIGESDKGYWDKDKQFLEDIAGRQPVQITSFDRRLDNPRSPGVLKKYKLERLPRIVIITDGEIYNVLKGKDVYTLESEIHTCKTQGKYFDKIKA